MNKYPNYYPSNVEWLGDIPEHWEVKKLKYVTNSVQTGNTPPSDKTEFYENGTVDWFTPSDFSDALVLKNSNRKITQKAIADNVSKLFPAYSILLVGIGATLGKLGIITSEASSNQQINAITFSSQINPYYGLLYLKAISQTIISLSNASTLAILNQSQTKDILVSVPPLPEQQAIASFLDDKTKQIDILIEKKQKLIELLKEERQALINEAVTKGINPKAKMKPSGVEWLGNIPEHWEVIPMTKYLDSIIDYRGRTPEKVDSGVFLVTARNIKSGFIDYSLSEEFVSEEEYEKTMRRGLPNIGDVLFTTEAPLGEVANVDRTDIALAQRVIKFSGTKNKLNNYFLKYSILSNYFQYQIQRLSTGSTAVGIKSSKLNQLAISLPNTNEQQSIVNYLDNKVKQCDEVSMRAEKEIELLQEYRTALITEVVTGKVCVVN